MMQTLIRALGVLFALSWFALAYLWIDARDQISILEDELVLAKVQRQQSPHRSDARPRQLKTVSDPRSRMFALLYEINRQGKKVHYRPGQLLIDDHGLVTNDRFLDLLDLLYEQGVLDQIEIPKKKNLREELNLAGFGRDFVTDSAESKFRVRIKDNPVASGSSRPSPESP
jgi:hypothetical protein